MLEVFVKFICFIIMYGTGFIIVNKIVSSGVKRSNLAYLAVLLLAIFSIFLYPIQYTPVYTMMVFLLNIIIYKIIYKLNIEEATIVCSIFMIILFISDLLVTLIFRIFYTVDQIRTDHLIFVMSNLAIGITCICIINTKIIYNLLKKFYENIKKKKAIRSLRFLILIIVGYCYLVYNITNSKTYGTNFIVNTIIMAIIGILAYIFIQNKNSYNQLSDEYDTLFDYVQNFEDWIEKEQLNRHEYKNQLAVLRCLTKEKKVKDKIDEILEDNINIEGEIVHKLKELPKGGLKGLMYYKAAIAQKNKIKLMVDVSLQRKTLLNKLTEDQIKVLCKLIGIYFDNAIEAAQETRKKNILLEIYEFKDKVNIVISNTYKKSKNFNNRNERGVTTKGEGRGNGLYFANNLIEKNNWIISNQEEIDDYYIQTLTIKN